MQKDVIIIGARGSNLSLIQTDIVVRKLNALQLGMEFKIEKIRTLNEKIDRSIHKETEKDIYTKEIDQALIEGRIDMAVHSLKDLMLTLPDGITIGCIADKDDPRDVMVTPNGTPLSKMDENAKIGTSSIRRKILLKGLNPKPTLLDIHGNLDSRISKVADGSLDGIVVAAAGLKRLNADVHAEYFDPGSFIPAIGQGAIAVTIRSNDKHISDIMRRINVHDAKAEAFAERAFGKRFGIGCNAPIGAYAVANGSNLSISGFIGDIMGNRILKATINGNADKPEALGNMLAERLIGAGGDELIKIS